MITRAYTICLLALYQLSIAAGILLLPIAVATKRFGITIPVHRLVKGIGNAYENTRTS